MEKVLNQEEIDAMVQAARGGAKLPVAPQVSAWDVMKAAQVRQEHMRALDQVHEGFARALAEALSAYLRENLEVALVSAEYLPFGDFLQRFPDGTYLASCKLTPIEEIAVIELDTSLAGPFVDLLLGGQGAGAVSDHEITEVEEQILAGAMRILCGQLQAAWQALGVSFTFEQRQPTAHAQRIMSGKDQVLALSFEMRLGEVRGTLNISIPALVSHALLRKLSAAWVQKATRSSTERAQRLRARLLVCPFELELTVQRLRIPLRALTALQPGQLIVFQRPVSSSCSMLVAGIPLLSATPARKNDTRAALINSENKDLAQGRDHD